MFDQPHMGNKSYLFSYGHHKIAIVERPAQGMRGPVHITEQAGPPQPGNDALMAFRDTRVAQDEHARQVWVPAAVRQAKGNQLHVFVNGQAVGAIRLDENGAASDMRFNPKGFNDALKPAQQAAMKEVNGGPSLWESRRSETGILCNGLHTFFGKDQFDAAQKRMGCDPVGLSDGEHFVTFHKLFQVGPDFLAGRQDLFPDPQKVNQPIDITKDRNGNEYFRMQAGDLSRTAFHGCLEKSAATGDLVAPILFKEKSTNIFGTKPFVENAVRYIHNSLNNGYGSDPGSGRTPADLKPLKDKVEDALTYLKEKDFRQHLRDQKFLDINKPVGIPVNQDQPKAETALINKGKNMPLLSLGIGE